MVCNGRHLPAKAPYYRSFINVAFLLGHLRERADVKSLHIITSEIRLNMIDRFGYWELMFANLVYLLFLVRFYLDGCNDAKTIQNAPMKTAT